MTTTTAASSQVTPRLSALDQDLLCIETARRPMHWCFLIRLRANAGRRVDVEELRSRVVQRATQRDVFALTVRQRRFLGPIVGVDAGQVNPLLAVRHVEVSGESQLRHRLAAMMATFRPTARLWELTLVDDSATGEQYLIVRVHHCLGDGLSASGFAYLFLDGSDEELAQFDRYLLSPRFALPSVDAATLRRSWRHLLRTWLPGVRAARPTAGPLSSTRLVHYQHLSAAAVNAAARSQRASQTEFVLASATMALKELLAGDGATTVRTMIPMTLDLALRHTGNAMAFALVNLPLTAASFDDALAEVRAQLTAIAAERPHYALPTLTQQSGGPWLYKRWASRAVMTAISPDLDLGLNPLHVAMDSVFGVDIEAVFPFSPLVYTPVSVAALLLGDQLTLGVNTDAAAVGSLGEVLVADLAERLVTPRAEMANGPAPLAV
jgi:diacylglycerol O-acyltransferase / wax synthase